ncbi:spore coat protein [Paenibacillus antri]|nr:spore coat protein [Paenibacillus antri]
MYTNTVDRAQSMRRGEASDRVWSGVILAELRQAAIGYTEAALESTAPDVRRVFERLAYDTARKHEQLTAILQQNRLLEPAFAAPFEEVQRAAAQAAETVRLAKTLHQAGRVRTPATAAAPSVPQMSYTPRIQGYSPYMNMQQPPTARPPEFALPHNMPFGGLPGGTYLPPQPQPQAQAQEAPAPQREPEPAVSSALREETSLAAVAPPAAESRAAEPAHEAAPTAPPAPKRSGGRRAKAGPAVEAGANEPEQLTT